MFRVVCCLATAPDRRFVRVIEAGSEADALRLACALLDVEPVDYYVVSVEVL